MGEFTLWQKLDENDNGTKVDRVMEEEVEMVEHNSESGQAPYMVEVGNDVGHDDENDGQGYGMEVVI